MGKALVVHLIFPESMRVRERDERGMEWVALWGECGYRAMFLETSYLGNSQEDGLTGDHTHPSKEVAATILVCIVFFCRGHDNCAD